MKSKIDSTFLETVSRFNQGLHIQVSQSTTHWQAKRWLLLLKASSQERSNGKISKGEDKMLTKYSNKLLDELIYVDNELSRAALSVVRE